jgi:hypothetical protein
VSSEFCASRHADLTKIGSMIQLSISEYNSDCREADRCTESAQSTAAKVNPVTLSMLMNPELHIVWRGDCFDSILNKMEIDPHFDGSERSEPWEAQSNMYLAYELNLPVLGILNYSILCIFHGRCL